MKSAIISTFLLALASISHGEVTIKNQWLLGEDGALVAKVGSAELTRTGTTTDGAAVATGGSTVSQGFTNPINTGGAPTANNYLTTTLTLANTSNWGFSAWVSLSQIPNGTNQTEMGIFAVGDINIEMKPGLWMVHKPGGGVTEVVSPFTPLPAINTPFQVSYVNQAGVATLYVNGKAASLPSTVAFASGTNPKVLLGSMFYPGYNYIRGFNGLIDEVTVFTFAAGQFQASDLDTLSPRTQGTGKDILTFGPGAVITGTNIAWSVPYGTSLASLAPAYTVSPLATGSPATGVAPNFATNNPATYTITAEDGSTQTYQVTVTVEPEAPVTINLAYMNSMNGTYYWQQAGSASQAAPLAYAGTTWNDGGNGSAAVSNLMKSDGTSSGISVSAVLRPRATGVNFGSHLGGNKLASYPAGLVLGSMFANDSAIQSGFVDILTFSGLAPNHSYNIVLVDPWESPVTFKYLAQSAAISTSQSINDWVSGRNYALLSNCIPNASGEITIQGTIPGAWSALCGFQIVDNGALPSTKDMLTFTFPSLGAATITGTNITLTVPYGTNVTALSPTYTHNGTSCSPASGSSQNFTSPVHYIVTAGDSSTQDYTVTVTVAPATKDMLTFTFPTLGAATIDGTNITMTVPYGTDVSALAPAYTHNGASCSPASGSSQDFSSPVHYIVTGADSGTKDYTVTVTVMPEAPVTINLAYMNTMDGTYYWQQAGSASQAAPLAYAGTTWNDGGNGSAAVSNLMKSDGTSSGISVSAVLRPRATGVNFGSHLGGNKLASYPAGLVLGLMFAGDSAIQSGFMDVLTFSGLAADHSYNIVLVAPWESSVTFNYLSQSAAISPSLSINDWVIGRNYALLSNCIPNASGEITIQETIPAAWSALCGFQIVDNGVVSSPTPPFSSWITAYYATPSDPNAAPDADPDGDGLKNSVEYVLGTLPNTSNQGGPGASTAGGNLVFTFQRALASKNPDTTVAIEASTDLGIWTAYDVDTAPEVAVTAGLDADHETVTLTLPMTPDTKKFARLRVTVTPAP